MTARRTFVPYNLFSLYELSTCYASYMTLNLRHINAFVIHIL